MNYVKSVNPRILDAVNEAGEILFSLAFVRPERRVWRGMMTELGNLPSGVLLLGTFHLGNCLEDFDSTRGRTVVHGCGGLRTSLSFVPLSLFAHLVDAMYLFSVSRNHGLSFLGRRRLFWDCSARVSAW